MAKKAKMTTCKHCGAEIAAGAKTCPKCGGKNKKPIYKRPWFIVLIALIVIGAISSAGGNGDKKTDSGKTGESKAEETVKEEINYTAYNVSELMSDLDGNAMKASDKYKDQYVELTGKLNNIDSNGKYIDIVPSNDDFVIMGVQCYIKSDEQKTVVMDLTIGDTIVVKGKITDVGEVLGYSLNIDDIAKAQ